MVSTEYNELLDWIAECCVELGFLNDDCDLLHGDISMGNIVIVRFLPNIIAAAGLDPATVNVNGGAGPLPITSATADTASLMSIEGRSHCIGYYKYCKFDASQRSPSCRTEHDQYYKFDTIQWSSTRSHFRCRVSQKPWLWWVCD